MNKRLFLGLFVLASVILASVPALADAAPVNGSLIKISGQPAVYYVWNGNRYVFPNEAVFKSWYRDFSGVRTVSASEGSSYSLSGNVTFKPGFVLVKTASDPKVYAISRSAVLRWVETETLARALYGANWNRQVADITGTLDDYAIGAPISSVSDYRPDVERGIASIALDIPGIVAASPPIIAGCQVFPADNAWNEDVSSLPLRSDSSALIASIGSAKRLHPDFGSASDIGIPYTVVPASQSKVPITFTDYASESDPGPYPIPSNAKVEAGDGHVLVLQEGSCKLYELYGASKTGSGWSAASGAVWDLNSNAVRTVGWTSADAAGLPILPGLVRYDEVASGEIRHAIRFTAPKTRNAYILPATHVAGKNDASLPPMGLRVRLKANYNISKLTGQARVIAEAMKTYGMILADDGSSWFFQGAPDSRWDDTNLDQLKTIPGSAFEAVDTGPVHGM